MSEGNGDSLTGPDLRTAGAALADIPDGGMLLGHVDGQAALLSWTRLH